MELQNMQDRSATTDDGVSGGASLPVAVGQSETRLGLPFQRPSNRRQDTTPWWRLFVQIRWGSILVVVPTLLLVVLVIQNIVFFHLNRPQDIVKELGALVATLPNSIPDHNCSNLACHWAALQTALAKLKAGQEALAELKAGQEAGQTALAELKAGQEAGQEAGQTALAELKAGQEAGQTVLAELKAGQTALAELKASHTAICSDLEASQSLLAKVWEEIRSNKGLLNETLKDLETDYKNMSQVIQRRKDGSVDFYRGWNDYRKGFGDLAGEHWLGLQNIHALTASGAYQLRIDFTIFNGSNYYALYDDFSVGRNSLDPEKDGYPLLVSGYSGNAGDNLASHSGMKFTTKDRDQDKASGGNCANDYKGAWWYNNCYDSNLNGMYKATDTCGNTNAVWHDLGGSYNTCLRFVEMRIRPRK
ncbi:fibrinogen C domain-containing protein 1-B isoform X4 [Syngnathus scovelli]|uniref:fibrinogen C domain-containing protein 1-B isoform X4 n=1 Tax=Syngnathus scovelli TaxID=161590 RepID=UPI0035CC9EC0